MPVHTFSSILGLVLGEKEEIFAQRAGEFRHFLAAVMGGAGGITLPLLYTTVDLKTREKVRIYRLQNKKNEVFSLHLHQNICKMFVSGMKAEGCVEFLDEPRSSFGVPHGCRP